MPVPSAVAYPSTRKPPLPALTGLRTLLALNVLLFHFTPGNIGWLGPLARDGFVFVGFFFLLSGFVLAYNYSDRALTLDARAFWKARFARLYPVYLLGLLLFLPMLWQEWTAHTAAMFWLGTVLTPLLLQGWSPELATFWNTVGWTLSCELLLYAAFPWVLRTWATRWTRLDTPARLASVFLVLWLIGMTPHLLYYRLNPDHLSAPANRYTYAIWLRMLKYSPPAYLCIFLAGITLGKLQLVLRLRDGQRLALAATGLLATGTLFYRGIDRVPYVILHGGLLMPIFAVLTLGLSGDNVLARLFAVRPVLLIGESSYCLYLLHFNSINLLHRGRVWERLHLAAYDPWISFAAALALALAAQRGVEQPARRAILAWPRPAEVAAGPGASSPSPR